MLLDANEEILAVENVTLECDSCEETKKTCLFAPACFDTACAQWQTFALSTPVALASGDSYAVSVEFSPAEDVQILAGIQGVTDDSLASNLLTNKQRTDFNVYSFRTIMEDAASENVMQGADSSKSHDGPMSTPLGNYTPMSLVFNIN